MASEDKYQDAYNQEISLKYQNGYTRYPGYRVDTKETNYVKKNLCR